MLVCGIDLADLAMFSGCEGGLVIFGSIDDFRSAGRLYITIRHCNRDTTECFHHISLGFHILYTDL